VPNHLALINVDGTNYRALTTPTLGQSDEGAAWSPRGDRIAFSRMTDGSNFPLTIHVINSDGTNLVRLSPSGALDDSPAWSPDGQRIAFVNQDPLDYRAANTQIYLMNADGSNRVRLTTAAEGAWGPTWSPDGRKIAFVVGLLTGHNSNIYVMDVDGTHLSALTNDLGGFDPAWSPDGSRIVFTRDGALVVMNADGTHPTRLTSPPEARWSYSDSEPAWSPDGQWVVFTRSYDCDPFNDNGGPRCVPNELRAIQLAGVPFVSSLVWQGRRASWGP
jgi:TolB protein